MKLSSQHPAWRGAWPAPREHVGRVAGREAAPGGPTRHLWGHLLTTPFCSPHPLPLAVSPPLLYLRSFFLPSPRLCPFGPPVLSSQPLLHSAPLLCPDPWPLPLFLSLRLSASVGDPSEDFCISALSVACGADGAPVYSSTP